MKLEIWVLELVILNGVKNLGPQYQFICLWQRIKMLRRAQHDAAWVPGILKKTWQVILNGVKNLDPVPQLPNLPNLPGSRLGPRSFAPLRMTLCGYRASSSSRAESRDVYPVYGQERPSTPLGVTGIVFLIAYGDCFGCASQRRVEKKAPPSGSAFQIFNVTWVLINQSEHPTRAQFE